MADRKITLRRNNSGTSEAMYPTTTIDQIMSTNGSTAAFDSNGKLEYAHLPDGIIGGLKFQHTITAAQTDSDSEIAAEIESAVAAYGVDGAVGSYWIASNEQTWYDAGAYTSGGATNSYGWTVHAPNEEDNGGGTGLTAEAGDWIIITEIALQSGNNYNVTLGVINNNYKDATTSARGVVRLATNAVTSTGTDTERAVTPAGLASVLSGYSTTNTTYTTSAVDSGNNAIIRLTGSDSSTEDITLVAGDNIAITPSGDNITIDSSHPSISAASTSSNSGRTYIQSLTLDSNGHITGISTGTETVTNTDTNDYLDAITKSGNTLTFSVGSQSDVTYAFGANAFNSTTIPSVTLNGSASTSPSFYAPTASGTAGSSTASRQALFSNGNNSAPTFVDAPKIFYDTTSGWLHGDIVFDVD